VDSVARWLEEHGLGEYAQVFAESDIDEEVLPELTDADLEKLGVTLGHRKKLVKAIAALPAGESAPSVCGPTSRPLPATSALSAEAERRQLTVMFCDLVGSTELSGKLDPEDLRDVISAFQDACKAAIESYEGYVAKYMGDGVLAYFGYPQAHEDDAERGVRAGLGIIEAMAGLNVGVGREKGTQLAVRVGIATGPVVVGDLIGHGASQESAVVGETPNLAARLQGLADANALVVAADTRRLTAGHFQYRDMGEKTLRGINVPVRVWQVLGESAVKSRFEAIHGRELMPLVGRDEEMALLLRRWKRAKHREGQLALISGEPGIGKSRLTETVREQIADESHVHLRYQCSPYHANSALYPVIAQLARAASFSPNDDADNKITKLEKLLEQSSDDFDQEIPLLASMMSISTEGRYLPLELDAHQQREATLAALVSQLNGLCSRGPVICIFEDVHWVDPTTLELLERLVEQVPSLPVLMLVTFRPEFTAPWMGQAHTTFIALNRMTRDDIQLIAQNVAGRERLPPRILNHIVSKTDGVPLFIEELTSTLLESGVRAKEISGDAMAHHITASLPNTLRDSLMARLDRLGPARQVAQVGAVIGREFSRELIAEVSGLDVEELQSALSLLLQSGLVFSRGHAYLFKHALVRDTAYESLLRSNRQGIHARIAQVLETGQADGAQAEPELIAFHHTEAQQNDRAVYYWNRAGERAVGRAAHAEAINHFSNALKLVSKLPKGVDRARKGVQLRLALADSMRIVDRIDDAFAVLDQAQTMASQNDLKLERAKVHELRGNLFFPLGDTERCLEEHELSRKFARDAGSAEQEARALGGLGDAYYLSGRMITAHDLFDRCVNLCQQHGYTDIEVAYLPMRALTYHYSNDHENAWRDSRNAVKLATKIAQHRAEMTAITTVGWFLYEQGDYAGAKEYFEQGRRLVNRLGARRFEPYNLMFLAEIESREGNRDNAMRLAKESVKLSREVALTFNAPRALAKLALCTEDANARGAVLKEGEQILALGCVSHNYLQFYRDAIEVSLRAGSWDEADRYATLLEQYVQAERFPWADFFIARGHALAAYGRGNHDCATMERLKTLRDRAQHARLGIALPALEAALTSS